MGDLFAETQRLYYKEFGEYIFSIKRIPRRKRPTDKNFTKLINVLQI